MSKMSNQRPRGRDKLFALLADLPEEERKLVELAHKLAERAHADQFRDDGSEYIEHPVGAALIFVEEFGGRDARIVVGALLHDAREDSGERKSSNMLLLSTIEKHFGEEVALDNHVLTRFEKGESVGANLRRIVTRGPETMLMKLLDCLNNMRTLSNCVPAKQRRQIEKTRQHR